MTGTTLGRGISGTSKALAADAHSQFACCSLTRCLRGHRPLFMSRALTLVTALVAVVAVNSAPCSPTTAVQLVGQFLTQAFVNFDINEAGSFTSGWLVAVCVGG